MKGLIIKDLINLKALGKTFLVLVAFYLVLAMTTGNYSMLGSITAVLCGMLPITALSYDEKARWDKYALTMPVSRRDMVISKYLLGLMISGAAFIIFLALNLFTSSGSIRESLLTSAMLFAVGITFMALVLPILFKYGAEKGRLMMMLVLFVPTGLIVLLSQMGFEPPGSPSCAGSCRSPGTDSHLRRLCFSLLKNL